MTNFPIDIQATRDNLQLKIEMIFPVKRKSLNGSDRTIRLRLLENDCKRLRKGLFELMTYDQAIEFINKPIDDKERLRIYRGAGRYGNNKRPIVNVR